MVYIQRMCVRQHMCMLSFEAPKGPRRTPLCKQVLAELPLLQQLGVHGCPPG